METSIVQSKRSLANAPIYLLICVNKELSTAIARPIAPICGFGKELFEVYRKFNGAPGAAEAAENLRPERNSSKKTLTLEKCLPLGDHGNRRKFQTPLTLDYDWLGAKGRPVVHRLTKVSSFPGGNAEEETLRRRHWM